MRFRIRSARRDESSDAKRLGSIERSDPKRDFGHKNGERWFQPGGSKMQQIVQRCTSAAMYLNTSIGSRQLNKNCRRLKTSSLPQESEFGNLMLT